MCVLVDGKAFGSNDGRWGIYAYVRYQSATDSGTVLYLMQNADLQWNHALSFISKRFHNYARRQAADLSGSLGKLLV